MNSKVISNVIDVRILINKMSNDILWQTVVSLLRHTVPWSILKIDETAFSYQRLIAYVYQILWKQFENISSMLAWLPLELEFQFE